jgi:hypothetical protein
MSERARKLARERERESDSKILKERKRTKERQGEYKKVKDIKRERETDRECYT